MVPCLTRKVKEQALCSRLLCDYGLAVECHFCASVRGVPKPLADLNSSRCLFLWPQQSRRTRNAKQAAHRSLAKGSSIRASQDAPQRGQVHKTGLRAGLGDKINPGALG